MATIDDYGDTSEPLNNPPLGGPSGWAKAVRDAITDNIAAIAGKVAKTGDTMTGPLTLPGVPTVDLDAATKGYVDGNVDDAWAKSITIGQDLNTVKTPGIWYGYNYTNGPVGNVIHSLLVLAYSNDWGTQIFVNHQDTGPRIWARSWSGSGGTTWSTWLRVEMT